jgi:hypothetical protein
MKLRHSQWQINDSDGYSKLRKTVLDQTAAMDILGRRDDCSMTGTKFLSTIQIRYTTTAESNTQDDC